MHLSNLASVLLLLSATTSCCVGNPPSDAEKWVWGRRQPVLPPAVGAVGAAAVVPSSFRTGKSLQPPSELRVQRRHGRVIARTTGLPALDTTEFKSITARSYPPTHPLNALDRQKQTKHAQKSTLKPSPIDTTFTSHFDVFSSKSSTSKPKNNAHNTRSRSVVSKKPTTNSVPTVITTGEYPYPFGAKPIDLGDGTSIGRVHEDTLPIQEDYNKKPSQQFAPPQIAEEHDARYTTLDKLFSSRGPTKLPDPHSLSNEDLGGLHPDEVYYANKDILVIKGGGFHQTDSYHIEEDVNGIEQAAHGNVQPTHTGNELGESNDVAVTNVRPDELFNNVPLPIKFFNGNVPTIVKPSAPSNRPPTSNRQHRTAHTSSFRPVHQTSFIPLRIQPTRPYYYTSSSSQQIPKISTINSAAVHPVNPIGNYQSLDGEVMLAQPSNNVQAVVPAPTKRSADSSVVSYHYQSRGSGSNVHSIVDYKVHRDGSSASNGRQHPAAARVQNPNIIHLPHKETVQHRKPQLHKPQNSQFSANTNRGEFGELEDLSVPLGTSILVPQVQIPRKRPSSHAASSSTPIHGTTAQSPHFVPSVQQPRPGQGTGFVPSHRRPTQKPISLAGDTRVNFLPPLPPVNRQAEFLARRPVSVGLAGNRSHGRPAVVRNRGNPLRQQGNRGGVRQHPQQQQSHRRQGTPTRFMEPRRRVPLRPRQNPAV